MKAFFKLMALVACLSLVFVACGEDENGDNGDNGNNGSFSGGVCLETCDSDEDCQAGYECGSRQVEEGKICQGRPDFR